MPFTVLNFPILPSHFTNQDQTMAAELPWEPRYGQEGAVLRNFRQKHQPHRPLVKAIGDDKETMERCVVWGVNWLSPPPGPLPEANKQSYLRQKDRKKRKKKPETKTKAKTTVKTKGKAKAKVKVEVKVALLKTTRKRKKRLCPRPSGGATPILQPNATTHALAALSPTSAPSTTQWTRASDRRPPSLSLPWAAAPWQVSGWVAMDWLRPRAPAPTISTFYPSHHAPRTLTALRPSLGPGTPGGWSQHATADNLYVHHAYPDCVVKQDQATLLIAPLSDRRTLEASVCISPTPYYPAPGLVDGLEQYAASIPCAHGYLASQGLDAFDSGVSAGLQSVYVEASTNTNVQPATALHSLADSRRPSIGPPLPTPDPCAESSRANATRSYPHTTTLLNARLTAVGDSVRGINDSLGATYQSFTHVEHSLPAGTSPSIAIPGMGTAPVESGLVAVKQTNGGDVPQTHTATIGNNFGATARYTCEEQHPHDVREVVQAACPPQGRDQPTSSVVALHIDRERSGDIKRGANDTYVHNRDACVQLPPVAPRATDNIKEYPLIPGGSSHSELSYALQYPSPTSFQLSSKTEDTTANPWFLVSPQVDVIFHAPAPSIVLEVGSAAPLALTPAYIGSVIDEKQPRVSTHLWSQSVYDAPQYPCNGYLHSSISTISAKIVGMRSLTHTDSQYPTIHYDPGAPA